MKRSHEAPALIACGQLKPENLDAFREAIRQLPDGRYALRLEPWTNRRSARANAYYWSCVLTPMSESSSAGDASPEEIHDAMCEKFLPNEQKRVEFFNRLTGECLTVETDRRRSSKLTGEPFYQFVEQVRKFALEFMGVTTENPDPEYWRRTPRATRAA
jgi:hypothetical protein